MSDAEDLARFIACRDAALLSMDEDRIREFSRVFNDVELPEDQETFWTAVHKARTGADTLPEVERNQSRWWLASHGFSAQG